MIGAVPVDHRDIDLDLAPVIGAVQVNVHDVSFTVTESVARIAELRR